MELSDTTFLDKLWWGEVTGTGTAHTVHSFSFTLPLQLLHPYHCLVSASTYHLELELNVLYVWYSNLFDSHLFGPFQAPSNWSSLRVGLGSLSQELRIHLNHWSCLFSKVQSDQYLRPALVRHTKLLVEIKQTLDLLGLQALVLMESYVYVVLSAVARTKLESVPREVLEDVLAGTDLYNQAVWERAQHSSTQLRTTVLQLAHYSTLDCSLTNRRGHCIAAFSVKELMMILALHHADRAAKQLHCWASDLSCHCQVHTNHKAFTCSDSSQAGTATLRSEWTWDQLQHTYLMYSPLFSTNHLLPLQSSSGTESSNQDQSSLCQTCISHTGLVQSSVEPLVSVQPNLERQTSVENCKLLQTLSPPLSTFQHLSAQPLSGVCQQAFLSSSVELLFQLLVSSSDLLAPHTPKPVAPTEQLLTDVSSPNGKRDTMTSPVTIINTAGSVELNRLSTEQNKEQHVEGTQQEWREVEATARYCRHQPATLLDMLVVRQTASDRLCEDRQHVCNG